MILQHRVYRSCEAAHGPNLSISRHKRRAPVLRETAGAVSGGWCNEFHMSLWGKNRVLIAMTSVAFGGRSAGLAEKIGGECSIAPVLPEIQTNLSIMQTRTTGSHDGCSDRKFGHEPSIHRLSVFLETGAAELAANAGRGI